MFVRIGMMRAPGSVPCFLTIRMVWFPFWGTMFEELQQAFRKWNHKWRQ